jgi:hypothetical protein
MGEGKRGEGTHTSNENAKHTYHSPLHSPTTLDSPLNPLLLAAFTHPYSFVRMHCNFCHSRAALRLRRTTSTNITLGTYMMVGVISLFFLFSHSRRAHVRNSRTTYLKTVTDRCIFKFKLHLRTRSSSSHPQNSYVLCGVVLFF